MAASYRRRSAALSCKFGSRADAGRARCALVAVILAYLVFAALARAENHAQGARFGINGVQPTLLAAGR